MPLTHIPFIKINSGIPKKFQEVPWFLRRFRIADLDIRNNQDRRYRGSGLGLYLDMTFVGDSSIVCRYVLIDIDRYFMIYILIYKDNHFENFQRSAE